MTLRPYKFVVTAVVQQLNDDGEVVGEAQVGASSAGEPFTLYGCAALATFAGQFPDRLSEVEQVPS